MVIKNIYIILYYRMSNPPNNFNTNTSFNKYKGSFFNDDIDISEGDIIN